VKLRKEVTISERRACRVVDQPRSCQRYADDEDALVKRMLHLVRQRPCCGKNFGVPARRGSIG